MSINVRETSDRYSSPRIIQQLSTKFKVSGFAKPKFGSKSHCLLSHSIENQFHLLLIQARSSSVWFRFGISCEPNFSNKSHGPQKQVLTAALVLPDKSTSVCSTAVCWLYPQQWQTAFYHDCIFTALNTQKKWLYDLYLEHIW